MGRREGSEADEDWAHIDATFLRWLDGELSAEASTAARPAMPWSGRMRDALQELADLHRGETVVVVSHGGADVPRPAAVRDPTSSTTTREIIRCPTVGSPS